jgi:AcrR family transcriptional regulator
MTTSSAQALPPRVDGRNARRDRNSEAVLDAVHELFAEGNLVPTAEDVAQRSGVSLRSVYRYFEDMEALLRAAIARRVAKVEHLFVLPDLGVGPFPDRVERFVAHRLVLYDRLAPTVRAALLRAPQAPPIGEVLAARRRQLLKQAEEHFAPELAQLGKVRGPMMLSCVDALCQFESMEHLRVQRRLSAARARATLITGVTTLLTGPP